MTPHQQTALQYQQQPAMQFQQQNTISLQQRCYVNGCMASAFLKCRYYKWYHCFCGEAGCGKFSCYDHRIKCPKSCCLMYRRRDGFPFPCGECYPIARCESIKHWLVYVLIFIAIPIVIIVLVWKPIKNSNNTTISEKSATRSKMLFKQYWKSSLYFNIKVSFLFLQI